MWWKSNSPRQIVAYTLLKYHYCSAPRSGLSDPAAVWPAGRAASASAYLSPPDSVNICVSEKEKKFISCSISMQISHYFDKLLRLCKQPQCGVSRGVCSQGHYVFQTVQAITQMGTSANSVMKNKEIC